MYVTKGQQLCMFAAGIAAAETLGHWWLGTLAKDSLPIKIGSYTFTQDWNVYAMVAWPVVLGVLVWFAWMRKERVPAL